MTPDPNNQAEAWARQAAESAVDLACDLGIWNQYSEVHQLKIIDAILKHIPLVQLLTENAELKADKKRLEWLIAHGAFISHSRDGEVCNVWFSHDPDDDGGGAVPVEGYPQKCYNDPREAIDAVMQRRRKGAVA